MPNVSNYKEQGGARTVIGGSLDVVSGGDMDIESGGALKIAGVAVTASAAQINASGALEDNNTLLETEGTTKACLVNGVTLIAGGTGIADMTLAAPVANARAIIRIASLSSGSVVVTCAEGVTVDGANDIMTFDAAEETIELVYKSATEWAIVRNDGGVALSASA